MIFPVLLNLHLLANNLIIKITLKKITYMKKNLLLIFAFCTYIVTAQTPCVGGFATVGGKSYPCNGLTLQSYISADTMGALEAQDSWGWTDPQSGKEYAVVALDNGTSFVDISNPTNPKYLARLDSQTGSSLWRDVKVYKNHAFIVSDQNGRHRLGFHCYYCQV